MRSLGLKPRVNYDALRLGYKLINDFTEAKLSSKKITFFTTGTVAKTFPELLQEISNDGHEIACHYHYHDLMYKESNDEIEFSTNAKVRFNYSSSFDPTEVSVYQVDDSTNLPVKYLLKKYVQATSGKEKTREYRFTNPKIYDKIKLEDEQLIRVKSIVDSDGDVWTRVPYLAQDTVFEQIDNNEDNSTYLHQYSGDTPYLLELNRVPKRYVTKFEDDVVE